MRTKPLYLDVMSGGAKPASTEPLTDLFTTLAKACTLIDNKVTSILSANEQPND